MEENGLEFDRQELREMSRKAKERRRQERIDRGEKIVRGTYRGERGEGVRSWKKYGMTKAEWEARGR